MGRTPLFGRLSRILARVLAEQRGSAEPFAARARAGTPPRSGPSLSRRQLTLGSAQLALGAVAGGCGGDDSRARPEGGRVVVVGAGIAGLHCAYRLQQSGVEVLVLEASSRVGGRMFTVRDEFGDGQLFEFGGELIDSNHATMFALAEELGIELDDRLADVEAEGILPDVWFVAGAQVPEATIVEQFRTVAPAMAEAAEAADDEEDDSAFIELDETPLSDWLDENVPPGDFPELHAILTSAYRGEFGLETAEQSSLNLLYLIGADEPEPFRIFGESDERYHAHTGSDTFPTRLAEELGRVVQLDSELRRLSGGDARGFTLELVNPKSGARREVHADHVVLALPFTVLRTLTLDVPLSELKRQIIDELGYGTNAKVVGSFETRVWREEHATLGSATSDLPLQQVWDSSIGQAGRHGILTNFLGGQAGLDVGDIEPETYFTSILSDLELIFPGVAAAYRDGTARLMHWPSSAYALGSYTCYRPGQWSFWTQEGVREGNLHFCGEHTSADFQGWMEGAAETGALVAAEVLGDMNVEPSPELAALLEVKTIVPQPGFPRAGTGTLSYRERQRRVGRVRPLR